MGFGRLDGGVEVGEFVSVDGNAANAKCEDQDCAARKAGQHDYSPGSLDDVLLFLNITDVGVDGEGRPAPWFTEIQ